MKCQIHDVTGISLFQEILRGFQGGGKVRMALDMFAYCLMTVYRCDYKIFNYFNPKDMHLNVNP